MVNSQDNPGDAQDAPPLPRVLCAGPLSHYARLADTSSKSGATASLNPNRDRAFIYKGLAPRSWSSKSRGEGGSRCLQTSQQAILHGRWAFREGDLKVGGRDTNMTGAPGSAPGEAQRTNNGLPERQGVVTSAVRCQLGSGRLVCLAQGRQPILPA